jgi:hypothetical protein
VFPSVTHRTGQYENNRAEVSHQRGLRLGRIERGRDSTRGRVG